jgi:DNA replicative helicase MCM subunit Mcm2 (Cdc46/Mcm family)
MEGHNELLLELENRVQRWFATTQMKYLDNQLQAVFTRDIDVNDIPYLLVFDVDMLQLLDVDVELGTLVLHHRCCYTNFVRCLQHMIYYRAQCKHCDLQLKNNNAAQTHTPQICEQLRVIIRLKNCHYLTLLNEGENMNEYLNGGFVSLRGVVFGIHSPVPYIVSRAFSCSQPYCNFKGEVVFCNDSRGNPQCRCCYGTLVEILSKRVIITTQLIKMIVKTLNNRLVDVILSGKAIKDDLVNSVNVGDHIIVTGLLAYETIYFQSGIRLFPQIYLEANSIVPICHEEPFFSFKQFHSLTDRSQSLGNIRCLFLFDILIRTCL